MPRSDAKTSWLAPALDVIRSALAVKSDQQLPVAPEDTSDPQLPVAPEEKREKIDPKLPLASAELRPEFDELLPALSPTSPSSSSSWIDEACTLVMFPAPFTPDMILL